MNVRFGAMFTAIVAVSALLASSARAEDDKGTVSDTRKPVAKALTRTGTFLRREAPDKPWKIVAEKEELVTGDLILGLPGATLASLDGGVQLSVRSDLSGQDPLPIFETVFILHEPKAGSLDFTLDRGRVVMTNSKTKGEANLTSRVRNGKAEITLDEPGAKAALELYGRWRAGVPFSKKPKEGDVPDLKLVFLVLAGEADIKLEGSRHAMKAPPGPAMFVWDSVTGGDPSPQRLDKLPAWAIEDETTEFAKKRKAAIEKFRTLITTDGIDGAIKAFLASDEPMQRRSAMFALGALDYLPQLGQAMREAKHPDVWDSGVLALRHWIGRGPGQDLLLFNALQKDRHMTELQAETVLQLLHDFDSDMAKKPETYETLIEFMSNDVLAIRGLAHWHLFRMVPDGQKIEYNPLDPKDVREKAIAKWKALIPAGHLPPATTGAVKPINPYDKK